MILRLLSVFAWGFATALYYARLGFHPLDASIVFDAGWRMLSGQVPIRDFATPMAIVPGAMQAVVFSVAGVDWWASCLHAALLNGLFGLVIYGILRSLAVGAWVAWSYAMLTALAFQPPFGPPLAALHSFFFVGVATLVLVGAAHANGRVVSVGLRVAVPFALALAFLSKPNPAANAVPFVIVAALLWRRPGRSLSGAMFALIFGTVLLVLVGWTTLEVLDIAPSQAWIDLWARPRRFAGFRVTEIGVDLVARVLDRGLYREGLLLPGVLWSVLGAAVLSGPRFWRWLIRQDPAGLERLAVAGGLCIVGLLFRSMSGNQPTTGIAFTFAAAGLIHGTLANARVAETAQLAVRAGILVLMVASAFDALYLTTVLNRTRGVNEIHFEAEAAASPSTPELSSMRYQASSFYRTDADELDSVVTFLKAQPENFLLIGDHSILYGITGRPSVGPSLWFHDGLTAPMRNSRTFAAHRHRMREALDRFDVGWVVVEGRRTGMYSSLDQYPGIVARIEAAGCAPVEIGNFSMHRLDSGSPCPPATGSRADGG